jgi:hypothetical protein
MIFGSWVESIDVSSNNRIGGGAGRLQMTLFSVRWDGQQIDPRPQRQSLRRHARIRQVNRKLALCRSITSPRFSEYMIARISRSGH